MGFEQTAGAGDRVRREGLSRSARSSPRLGRRPRKLWRNGPIRPRRICPAAARRASARSSAIRNLAAQLPGDRRAAAATPSTRASIAQEIVAFSEANGGYFSLKDFADHTVGMDRAGLDQLPRLRRVGAAAQRPGDRRAADAQPAGAVRPASRWAAAVPDYLHLFVEAKKLAFADRAKFYADPARSASCRSRS